MKAAIIILVFCVIVSFSVNASEKNNELFEAADNCGAKLGVEYSKVIKELQSSKDTESLDPKVRCFFKCFWEELKWMDSNTNEFLFEGGPTYGLDEEVIQLMKKCADSVSSEQDPCDKANNLNKCIQENKPQD